MSVLFILVSVVIFLISLLFFLSYQDRKYLESHGVRYAGNGIIRAIHASFNKIPPSEDFLKQYNTMKSKNQKLVGSKDFGKISIMVADLDLLKSILIKEFEHFTDRRQFAAPKHDFLLNRMLFLLKGESWKVLKAKMSPTFTPGKLKRMFNILDESSKKFENFIQKQVEDSSSGEIDLEEGCSKYTMDVIASAACGMDSKAFESTEASLFERMGKKLQLKFEGLEFVRILFIVVVPKLADFFGLSFLTKEVQNFFAGAIKSFIKQRQQAGFKRDDFIQLMMEAREGKLDDNEVIDTKLGTTDINELLSDDGIAAQSVMFIFGGFDSVKSLLLFSAYALALNPEVQDKLRMEVVNVLEENDGKYTYDVLAKMTYLDMFINETLRIYPPTLDTDRTCTKDYKLPGTDLTLKKGEVISIPIIGFHHDERYFPRPEVFDPERFFLDNKSKLIPYSYMPFGQGPRNCIGMRFALLEVKLAVVRLVKRFTIEPSTKTLVPMKYKNTPTLTPLDGMWLKLIKI